MGTVPHTIRVMLAAAAMAAALSAPRAFADDKCALKPMLTLQMEKLPSGHVALPITLNGRPSHLIFDTGGGVRSLTSAVVDELHLKRRQGTTNMINLQGKGSRDQVTVGLVEFGGAQLKNIEFSVMAPMLSSAEIKAQSAGKKPDDTTGRSGNLIFDGLFTPEMFFTKADVDLDFAADKFTLVSNDHCDGKVVYWPAPTIAVVPFRLDQGNHIIFDVVLNGKSLDAILDTGSTRAV